MSKVPSPTFGSTMTGLTDPWLGERDDAAVTGTSIVGPTFVLLPRTTLAVVIDPLRARPWIVGARVSKASLAAQE